MHWWLVHSGAAQRQQHSYRLTMTLGFTLPLYVFLAGQTALATILMLPLPVCKPGVVFIRFMSTPVGKSISTTALLFLVGATLACTLLGASLSALCLSIFVVDFLSMQ